MFVDIELKDMAMDEYHARPEWNMSLINTVVDKSVLHMLHEKNNPKEYKSYFAFGTAFHRALLEPETYNPVILPEGDRRTKAWKEEFLAKFPEVVPASVDEMIQQLTVMYPERDFLSLLEAQYVDEMKASCYATPKLAKVLDAKTYAEKCVFATEETTGLRVKLRLDFYSQKMRVGIDVKTTQDASKPAFQSDIFKYRYYRSYAFYHDILKSAKMIDEYRLLAVEKVPPFGVSVWKIDGRLLLRGREEYMSGLRQIKEYQDTGVAKSYEENGGITFILE